MLLTIMLLLGGMGLSLSSVAAQTAVSPTFTTEASYTFGQTLTFQLTGDNEFTDVEQLVLFFRSEGSVNTYTADLPITAVSDWPVTHDVDLTSLRLPPFVEIRYWWRITLADNSIIDLPSQTIYYADDQFDWQTLTQQGITVNWVGDGVVLGQTALDIVAESLPRLRQVLPIPDDVAFDLYLYPTSADLRAALRLTGRDWVGAHAHPELGVLLVTAVNPRTAPTDLRQSIPHEMAHLFLYQATGPNYERIPQWFNEGLATYMESSPNPAYEILLQEAVNGRITIPLTDLCHTFPAREERALLAYAQSDSLVGYIQAHYGNQGLRALVAAFADGADCQTGVQRALGLSLTELNQAWLQSLEPRSPLIDLWQANRLWLLLLLVGFGLMGLLIRPL